MADPTLLVPGTQATKLVDGAGVTVFNAVRVSLGLSDDDLGGRPPSEFQTLLSMSHAPGQWAPVNTSLSAGTTLAPGRVVTSPYDRLSRVGDPFPYDWRADIRWNARSLLHFLRQNRPPGGGRWNLIGHSQGGLLIVLASKLADGPDEFARLVGRVVLVGVPLAGTMRALEALLFGREDLGPQNLPAVRAAARTWPALYQMLPSWLAVRQASGEPRPREEQFTEEGGWPDLIGPGEGMINPDLLMRARETHTLLSGPYSHFGPGLAVLSIHGNKQQTPATIRRVIRRFETRSTTFEPGDGLVPLQRTLDWGGTPYARTVLALGGRIREHSFLCADEEVLRTIRRFLARPAPPPPASRPPLGPIA
jgi:pimeloyl-ACP methyl ester carboxylesterase